MMLAKKDDGGGNKEVMDLLKTILQGSQESTQRIEEDRRRAEDKHAAEMRQMQEKHDAELKEIRRETEKRAESA